MLVQILLIYCLFNLAVNCNTIKTNESSLLGSIGSYCDYDYECSRYIPYSICLNNKCACDVDYKYNNNGICLPTACLSNYDCSNWINRRCSHGSCVCQSGYTESEHVCGYYHDNSYAWLWIFLIFPFAIIVSVLFYIFRRRTILYETTPLHQTVTTISPLPMNRPLRCAPIGRKLLLFWAISRF